MYEAPDELMMIDFEFAGQAFGNRIGDLFELFNQHDPEGLIFEQENLGEYRPEVTTTLLKLDRCNTKEEVLDLLIREFTAWFSELGDNELTRVRSLADDVYKLKQSWDSYSTIDKLFESAKRRLELNTIAGEIDSHYFLDIIFMLNPSDKAIEDRLDDFVEKHGMDTKNPDLKFEFHAQLPSDMESEVFTPSYFRSGLRLALSRLIYYIPRHLIKRFELLLDPAYPLPDNKTEAIALRVNGSDMDSGRFAFVASPDLFMDTNGEPISPRLHKEYWVPAIVTLLDFDNHLLADRLLEDKEPGKQVLGKLVKIRNAGLVSLVRQIQCENDTFGKHELVRLREILSRSHPAKWLLQAENQSDTPDSPTLSKADMELIGRWFILHGILHQNKPVLPAERTTRIMHNPDWSVEREISQIIGSALKLGPYDFIQALSFPDVRHLIHLDGKVLKQIVSKHGKIINHRFGLEKGSTKYTVIRIREDILVDYYNQFSDIP
jgi:hypothetical protein